MKEIYFDHSATTAVKREVLNVMIPYFNLEYGNPSSLYYIGREAKRAIECARRKVARAINCCEEEVYFTSCGSESDNLAIKGFAYANRCRGNHIITSKIEHPAVLNTCKNLEHKGFRVTYLNVDENGFIDINQLKRNICNDTILISIMMANNELGTIQNIQEIGRIAHCNNIVFHTDAVQAVGNIKIDVQSMNVDMLSMSAHKFYGPKGVGALYIKKGVRITPLIHGGGQERGIRSGTENVPGIVGFGKACEIANNNLEENYARLVKTRDEIIEKVLDAVPESYLNGDKNERLPNVINFRFSSIEGESLILLLDAKGYQASTGSACSSKTLEASPVLKALNLDDVDVHGSLRISLGSQTHFDDVDGLVEAIKESVATLRKMSPLWNSDEKYEEMMGQSK